MAVFFKKRCMAFSIVELVSVPYQNAALTYTGSAQSVTWADYDSSVMSVSGTTSATNAGTYTATFTLNDTAKYQWDDGSTDAKTVSWSIGKQSLAIPYKSGATRYTGSYIYPTFKNYSSSVMTRGGKYSAEEPGTYTATFTLKDTANYQWSDGTTAAKNVSWTLEKAIGTITMKKTIPTQVEYGDYVYTDCTYNSDAGYVSRTSSNESVLQRYAGTVAFYACGLGVATIKISTIETDNYTAASKSFTITVV